MRLGVLVFVAVLVVGCGSTDPKLAGPPKVTQFVVQSQLLGKPMYEELVTPDGGGKGRPLLVFLHGYGGTPSGTADPAFRMALRRLGDRAPVVLFPQGNTSWWHDREKGRGAPTSSWRRSRPRSRAAAPTGDRHFADYLEFYADACS